VQTKILAVYKGDGLMGWDGMGWDGRSTYPGGLAGLERLEQLRLLAAERKFRGVSWSGAPGNSPKESKRHA